MQRNEWTFDFTAKDLLEACQRKLALHGERVRHWTERRDESEQKLRTDGIDFRQAANMVATSVGYNSVSNSIPRPTFDNELLAAFSEAQGKVLEHESRIRDYGAFERSFQLLVDRGEPGKTFALHADDVQYFGL